MTMESTGPGKWFKAVKKKALDAMTTADESDDDDTTEMKKKIGVVKKTVTVGMSGGKLVQK